MTSEQIETLKFYKKAKHSKDTIDSFHAVISCLNKELLEHLNNQSSEGISVWHAAEWFTWETSKKYTQTLQATPWEYCKSQMQRLVLWHLETVSFNQKDCIASNPTKKQWS